MQILINLITNIALILFWFIVILTPLVIVHELGHLLISRLFRVKIPEFGIGLPLTKHRIKFTWRKITWSIYPWLLGGFVRIFGDNDAIDEADYQNTRKNPDAKKNFISQRTLELLNNQDVEPVLMDNSLSWDDQWKWFCFTMNTNQNLVELNSQDLRVIDPSIINYKNLPANIIATDPELGSKIKQLIVSKLGTLKTLVEWEYEAIIEKEAKLARRETFYSKNLVQKTLIIFGGIIFNFAFAYIMFVIMFGLGLATGGSFGGSLPTTLTTSGKPMFQNEVKTYLANANGRYSSMGLYIQGVNDNSLAKSAGIKKGDDIIKIGNVDVTSLNNFEDLKNILNKYKGQKFNIEGYFETGQNSETKIKTIDATNIIEGDLKLGVLTGYRVQRIPKDFFNVFQLAWQETADTTKGTFEGLGQIFSALNPLAKNRDVLQSVTGPVGIGSISNKVFGEFGFHGIIYLFAVLSISLAVLNMLPIPALDGGRFVIILLTAIIGKRNKKIEGIVISLTFLLLIGISVLVAGSDILKFVIPK